jgi:hypothetical protein
VPALRHCVSQCCGVEQIIDGGVVVASVPLPDTDDVVVLLDPERRPDGVLPWHPFHNVLRVSPSGEIGWRAELVPGETTAKCWHAIRFGGVLRASTYSFDCVLDPDTGRIVESTFTK